MDEPLPRLNNVELNTFKSVSIRAQKAFCALLLLRDARRANCEWCAQVDLAGDFDCCTVCINSPFDDRQAQSRAGDRTDVGSAVEGIKDMGYVTRWDADALIDDVQDDVSAVLVKLDELRREIRDRWRYLEGGLVSLADSTPHYADGHRDALEGALVTDLML